MNEQLAVEVINASKRFRLIKERNHSLKASVLRGRRTIAEEFWAFRDVSFDVKAGETFGIIGENGSGKSTMLKCLTKILRPDEGSVAVQGKISALLELGSGFHPELSGRENIFLNGAILGLSQRELRRRFDDIVAFAGIERFIDEPVKNYSSGMYVRLGFSVAINVDPDVLLLDEILAVGDEEFQRKCHEKFAELRDEGKTIVLVSHGLGAVENICERVAWFDHGRLRKVGDPHEVIVEYTGQVHVDSRLDEEGRTRWGSGEAEVDKIELLDARGQPTTKLTSGDTAKFRLHYRTERAIERPTFGVAIHTVAGNPVAGSTNRDGQCVPEKLEGEGWIEMTWDVRLVPGTYDVNVSLQDFNYLHTYDVRRKIFRFQVERGDNTEGYGVVQLGGRWQIPGQIGAGELLMR